jgi:hypothetical protein
MTPSEAHAFSLKLTEQVIEAALRSPKGFVPYIQDQIARKLRERFPRERRPEFVVALEGAYFQDSVISEQFHLHGAIEIYPPSGPYLVVPGGNPRNRIEDALREAGGVFPAAKRARQLLIKPMYGPLGWFTYIAKYRLSTINALPAARRERGITIRSAQEKVTGATTGIRRAGKTWFNAARSGDELFLVPRLRKKAKRKR